MDLRDFLAEIAHHYDRAAGLNTAPQRLLRNASALLAEHAPHGMTIIGSGGKGTATHTPWVGFFDPEETETPQRGIYIAYLFASDLQAVVLSLQQGMEELRRAHGDRQARERLSADADAIHARLRATGQLGDSWSRRMDLRSNGVRQNAYRAGNIASVSYDTASLGTELHLRSELASLFNIYAAAVDAKRHLLVSQPGSISSSASTDPAARLADPLIGFRPKSADDYRSVIESRELVKTRRHERLVNSFAEHCRARGAVVASPHPCDLLATLSGSQFLIEAKVVYRGNATDAVRAAVGQLLAYRHFLYSGVETSLVALFTESVGDGYVDFLASLGIAAIWWDSARFVGSAQHPLVGDPLV